MARYRSSVARRGVTSGWVQPHNTREVVVIAPPMAVGIITILIIVIVVLLILGLLGRGRF
jgi:hypothetical protein